MANSTPSTGNVMVQTEWIGPTGAAPLVTVKLDLSFKSEKQPSTQP